MKREDGFWRDLWGNSKTSIVLFLGSFLFLIYSVIAIRYEIGQGWKGHPSVQHVLQDISRFIPVAAAFVAAFIGVIDLIVFCCVLRRDRKKKRFQEAVKEAVEAAKTEGYDEGFIDGQQAKDSGEPWK